MKYNFVIIFGLLKKLIFFSPFDAIQLDIEKKLQMKEDAKFIAAIISTIHNLIVRMKLSSIVKIF